MAQITERYINATVKEVAAAFTEWDRRYREDPKGFETDMERLSRGQTVEDYGSEVTPYFIELLNAVNDPEPAEEPT